jgi:hypothetical protein
MRCAGRIGVFASAAFAAATEPSRATDPVEKHTLASGGAINRSAWELLSRQSLWADPKHTAYKDPQ